MATSARVVSVTTFERSDQNDEWYFSIQAANGEIVGGSMGEGYTELRSAVNGFFALQGDDLNSDRYSDIVRVSDRVYRIEKYAA